MPQRQPSSVSREVPYFVVKSTSPIPVTSSLTSTIALYQIAYRQLSETGQEWVQRDEQLQYHNAIFIHHFWTVPMAEEFLLRNPSCSRYRARWSAKALDTLRLALHSPHLGRPCRRCRIIANVKAEGTWDTKKNVSITSRSSTTLRNASYPIESWHVWGAR